MSARPGSLAPWILLCAAAALFAAGMFRLFEREFTAGGAYPEYSSLRTDPDGASLLYESLERIPGVTVARNYFPLEFSKETGAAFLALGTSPYSFDDVEGALRPVEKIAQRGNRVTIAFRYEAGADPAKFPTMEKRWGVRCAVDSRGKKNPRLYFAEARGWTAIETVAGKQMAIERAFGRGSVALYAESDDFANYATVAGDRLRQVASAIGPHRRIIFDEEHLGISESGSMVDLARRFRMSGAAVGLAIFAALFLWKSAAGFPPPSARSDAARYGRASQAGLATLLRRHVRPRELAAACWDTWLEANRHSTSPERLKQAEAIVRETANRPLEAVRHIREVLQSKGTL